jgi:hypothetical protein
MEKQDVRQSSGVKAIALDTRAMLIRYRLQLLALLLSAAFALGLHLIFGR